MGIENIVQPLPGGLARREGVAVKEFQMKIT
jgi:hypothetical protein